MKPKKKIILVGHTASGKDFFRDYLIENKFKPSISHTTRPMRKGEKDGTTYHFVKDDEFKQMIQDSLFFENKEFNGWLYGTSKKSVKKAEVFIFTPSGIKSLPNDFLGQSIIVFFDIDQEIRTIRLSKRNDGEVSRRIVADYNDFYGFKEFTIKVTNPKFDPKALLQTIMCYDGVM
jgi:guanylate kinase